MDYTGKDDSLTSNPLCFAGINRDLSGHPRDSTCVSHVCVTCVDHIAYIRWEGVACTSKTRFIGSAAGCKFSTDRDTGITSLIPDASLASLIPNQIRTLHAQVCKFGHQWEYARFRNAIMQSRKFTGFR